MSQNILIVGAGEGLSFSLAKIFHNEGMKVSLASRNIDKLKNITSEIDAYLYNCDVSEIKDVESLFHELDNLF